MKYRKKPVEIEAWQFDGSWRSAQAIMAATGSRDLSWTVEGTAVMTIKTLEGTMTASPGDYIIRGLKGELYPCKPDIFAASYDVVE